MVDGLNPQTGNLLRELSGGNRQGQESQAQQSTSGSSGRDSETGSARPVSEVSVEISAEGFQQSSGEQLTSEAVTPSSATDTNVASTFASADFGDASRVANEEARTEDSSPEVQGPVAGSSRLSADDALGTNVDTRA